MTPIPGTTRDLVTETADVDGLRLELVDTAGVRETDRRGRERGSGARAPRLDDRRSRAGRARRVLPARRRRFQSAATRHDDAPRLIVANKSDLPAAWRARRHRARPLVIVSSKTGDGLDALRVEIRAALEGANPATARDTAAVTNVRHAALLERARGALRRAARGRGGTGRTGRGRIRADGSSGRARRARGSDRQAHVGGSAAAHLLAVLYWKVIVSRETQAQILENPCVCVLRET